MTPETGFYIYVIAHADRKNKCLAGFIDEIDLKLALSLRIFVQELKSYVHTMEALLTDFNLYQEAKLGDTFHKFSKM